MQMSLVLVEYLLLNSARVNVLDAPTLRTPMHVACECGFTQAVCRLLKRAQSVDAWDTPDAHSRTPLDVAVHMKHADIVTM